LPEKSGRVVFVDFSPGVTVLVIQIPLTGLSFYEMIEEGERPASAKDMKPMLKLVDKKSKKLLSTTTAIW
jgi:DNA-directed RNA polymerase subunit beta'